MALALSSLATKTGTDTALAISPQSFLNCSVLGVFEGISMKNILALKQAIEVMNVQCKSLFLSNSIGVGGFFGRVQNGFPSLVTASRG